MSLAITNNVASLNAQNNLSRTSNMLSKSLERLSSGLKINRGADGPAALVISEQQRAQISGLQTALSNTSKAVAMVQTTEGALNEINGLLTKIRGLALDSANSGVNDASALAANQSEVANALSTIDRIAVNTQFGTKRVLDGSAGLSGTADNAAVTFLKADSVTSPAGAFNVNITSAATRANTAATTDQTSNLATDETLTVNNVSIKLTAGQTAAQVRATINSYTGQTGVVAELDSGGTRLRSVNFGSAAEITVQSNVANAVDSSGFGTAQTTVNGTDIAGTLQGFTATGNGNVLTGTAGDGAAGISISVAVDSGDTTSTEAGALGTVTVTDQSLVFQIGANANQTVKVAVDNAKAEALGINVANNQFANLSAIDVQNQSGAQDTIAIVDQAISDISNLRARLGAVQQQTLESNANNLRTTLENTTAAESVIRDTDFAVETANFTKNQVLMQVGATVLSNSNQTSQLILSLLRQ